MKSMEKRVFMSQVAAVGSARGRGNEQLNSMKKLVFTSQVGSEALARGRGEGTV